MFYPYPVYTFFQCKICQKNILLHISGMITSELYLLPENVCLNCFIETDCGIVKRYFNQKKIEPKLQS